MLFPLQKRAAAGSPFSLTMDFHLETQYILISQLAEYIARFLNDNQVRLMIHVMLFFMDYDKVVSIVVPDIVGKHLGLHCCPQQQQNLRLFDLFGGSRQDRKSVV